MSTPDMTKTGRLVPSNFTPGVTAGSASTRQQFAGLRIRFKHLDAPTQSFWWQAAATLNVQQGRTGKKKLTAANAYVMLNSGRISVGLPISDTPGNSLSVPPNYPAVEVVASNVNGAFSVRLSSAAFACRCILLLARPEPIGKDYWADGSFKPAGVLTELTGQGENITGQVVAAFGVQPPGMEIPVRLLAVTEAGVKRGSLTAFGLVGDEAADATGDNEDENTQLHAA